MGLRNHIVLWLMGLALVWCAGGSGRNVSRRGETIPLQSAGQICPPRLTAEPLEFGAKWPDVIGGARQNPTSSEVHRAQS